MSGSLHADVDLSTLGAAEALLVMPNGLGAAAAEAAADVHLLSGEASAPMGLSLP